MDARRPVGPAWPPRARPGARRGRSRVEPDPEAIEQGEPWAPPTAPAVRTGDGAPGELDTGPAQWLGRERERRRAHHRQRGPLRLPTVDQVERDPGAEPAPRPPPPQVARAPPRAG